MSRATKRKHVLLEVLKDDYSLPQEGQEIVKVLSSRGNNLHEVEDTSGETYLVSMPTKFRKNVWVKRGDYVLVESIAEGDKVKAEMVRILSQEHIKCFKKAGVWPEAFGGCNKVETSDDDDFFVNANRKFFDHDGDDDEEEESSDDDSYDSDESESQSEDSQDFNKHFF